jgi:CRISPR-associated protein Csd2
MRPRACIVFRHESQLGNARADQLFDRVVARLKPEVRDENKPPRSFADYDLTVDEQGLPPGISIERWV